MYLSGRTSETLTVVLDHGTSLVFRGVVNDDRSARSAIYNKETDIKVMVVFSGSSNLAFTVNNTMEYLICFVGNMPLNK
jgi:hypothetical protein